MIYSKGDKVRITDNLHGHDCDIGEIVTIARKVPPCDDTGYEDGFYQLEPDKYGAEWYVKEEEFEPWEIQTSGDKKFEILCKFVHDKGLEDEFREYVAKHDKGSE